MNLEDNVQPIHILALLPDIDIEHEKKRKEREKRTYKNE